MIVMLVFDSFISTLQSSLQTVYGLLIGPLIALNDLKKGKPLITSSQSVKEDGDKTDSLLSSSSSSSSSSNLHCEDTDDKELKSNEKNRVIKMMIKDGLACWHFLATLAHIIKRAIAVKIHIVKPDKIALNQRRVVNLFSKTHDTIFKQS